MGFRISAGLLIAACAAGPVTADDGFLERYAVTGRFRYGTPSQCRVVPDGSAVLFLRSEPRSPNRTLWQLDLATGDERRLLTAGELAGDGTVLTPEHIARLERARISARGIATYELSPDGRRVVIPAGAGLVVFDRIDRSTRALPDGTLDARFSPDGGRLAYVVDGDIHVVELAAGTAVRLTRRESDSVTWGLAEFVAQEEMDRSEGLWWSPDSARLIVQRTDVSAVETFSIADPADPGRPVVRWPYPRAGRANADVRLVVVSADGTGDPLEVLWDRAAFPYVARVVWAAGAAPVVVVQDRAQRTLRLLAIDPTTGATREIVRETDSAWVELDPSVPEFLADGSGFLWSAVRDGTPRLELRRTSDGSLVRPLSGPVDGYRKLVHVDAERGYVWIHASADPTCTDVVRIPLDPTRGTPRRFASPAGEHEAAFFGVAESGLWVHAVATADARRTYTVRDSEGGVRATIANLAESPDLPPRVDWIVAAGKYYAAIVRPREFDAARKYPVIVHVYGGPHERWVIRDAARLDADQWMADRGYVVVRIANRGTPGRGRDWERAIHGDLAGPLLDDQVEALQDPGRRFPEIDLERVGIHGWSFGGYAAAMAVLRRPDVFRAAVVGAPVTEWTDYDTHYTERYLGLPRDCAACYERSSILTWIERPSRALLIIHGTADDNVYFAHGLKLADALLRAGAPVEFLPLAGETHTPRDPARVAATLRRTAEFFDRHLGPSDPPRGRALEGGQDEGWDSRAARSRGSPS